MARSVRLRKVGIASAGLIALAVIPQQLRLGWRWAQVHAEAVRVVAWIEGQQSSTGHAPPSLDDFESRGDWVREYIRYVPRDDSVLYVLEYHVGTRSTSHWYNAGDGWTYYPD